MNFQGAVIREQGVSFAVVIVKPYVLNVRSEADSTLRAFTPVFGGLPVILMAQDGRGNPTYYGRRDIARFMSGVPLSAVRWQRFTAN